MTEKCTTGYILFNFSVKYINFICAIVYECVSDCLCGLQRGAWHITV